jgi:uncharacterized protein
LRIVSHKLLRSLVDYDVALLEIVRIETVRRDVFPGNPTPIFGALAVARLPVLPEPPEWVIEILPDGFSVPDFPGNAAISKETFVRPPAARVKCPGL